jgi:hypothetical protein
MPDDARRQPEAQPDASRHDDVQPCIKTVIASLPSRSKKDREALLQALMDGDALKLETPPVSGTTTPEIVERQLFKQRSLGKCSPRLSPEHPLNRDLSLQSTGINR